MNVVVQLACLHVDSSIFGSFPSVAHPSNRNQWSHFRSFAPQAIYRFSIAPRTIDTKSSKKKTKIYHETKYSIISLLNFSSHFKKSVWHHRKFMSGIKTSEFVCQSIQNSVIRLWDKRRKQNRVRTAKLPFRCALSEKWISFSTNKQTKKKQIIKTKRQTERQSDIWREFPRRAETSRKLEIRLKSYSKEIQVQRQFKSVNRKTVWFYKVRKSENNNNKKEQINYNGRIGSICWLGIVQRGSWTNFRAANR